MSAGSSGHNISMRQAWWAVFVLFLAYIFSYVDRSILSLLVRPLKADMQLSDTEIGLVTGVAFAAFYATVTLLMARFSDRGSRRNIIAIGIVAWSIATVFCGLAQKYWQLFLARMGVGVGEAVLGPASMSLVADLFPKELRGYALGLFVTAIHVGSGLALIIGGSVVGWLEGMKPIDAGFMELRPWQMVFVVVGLPGLLVALLTLTIPEPRREAQKAVPEAPTSEWFRFMRRNWVPLVCITMTFALSGTMNFGFTAWGPTYFMRHFGFTPLEVGMALGLPVLVFAATGGMIAGFLLRYWTKKGRDDAPILVAMVGMAMNWPLSILLPLMPTPEGAMGIYILLCFLDGIGWVSANAALQLMTPARFRARIAATYSFVVTVVALAAGPLVIGLLTDYFYKSPADIGKSMALIAVLVGPWTSILLPLCMKTFRRAVREAEANP